MVLSREAAARAAEKKKTNDVGMCQSVTRSYYNAPSVGDYDGDGAADAEDGWKREPSSARRTDRNPPRGVPVSFVGGRKDNGHRAISLGGGVIRSTDFNGSTKRFAAGTMGNGTIAEIEKAMGVTYVGWSTTISGIEIPTEEPNVTEALRIHGVDISHHQSGVVGWATLKASGVQWLYHKATEGSTFKDKNYAKRRKEAKAASMPFGAYHFARPTAKDAVEEARFFIGVAKPVPGDLIPCLDLEVTDGLPAEKIKQWADQFCAEVERLTGVVPLVYTPFTLSAALEKKALFWVPRYNNENKPPVRRWDIWQFSNGVYGVPNRVNGLGNVDLNHSKVKLNDLLIPKATPEVWSRGIELDKSVQSLKIAEKRAKPGSDRLTFIQKALANLRKIKKHKKS